MTFKRFTWLFYIRDRTTKKFKIIATVAKVLNANADSRCIDVKTNPDLICVLIENDGGQCSPFQEDFSFGYLTYYQRGKKFYNFAIWSHGAEKCQTAKHQVAFFTRLNEENIRLQIVRRISQGALCSEHTPTKMYGFKTASEK